MIGCWFLGEEVPRVALRRNGRMTKSLLIDYESCLAFCVGFADFRQRIE